MPAPCSLLHIISKCAVKPSPAPPTPPPAYEQRCHLTPWDLAMLSAHYIQKGLLFSDLPPSLDTACIIELLKSSLALALHHFYPLAGRLVTEHVRIDENDEQIISGMFVSIDCNAEGAEFVHAAARGVTVADVLAGPGGDVAAFVRSFFPLDGAIGNDGHTHPLLAVQLTELADGVFLGCSFNHAIGDGTSYWHFFNAWAEISRNNCSKGDVLSRPPVHDRCFIEGGNPPIMLPYTHHDQFVQRFSPPGLRERIFHFSSESIARLKVKANAESPKHNNMISSFQALSALLWRCITRARSLPAEHVTGCRLAMENRGRLRPPLSPDYFGNSIYPVGTTAAAGELLAQGLGWAAARLHESVTGHTDGSVRERVRGWVAAPVVYRLSLFDEWSVMMGSSPRFDMYGCEFGWGRAVAVRSGGANKFCGKVTSYPGREGGGSVDLEVCLKPEFMATLELDHEFMAALY